MKRLGRKQLAEIAGLLSGREKAVLQSLQTCRYLTSVHIKRLHFTTHSTDYAAARAVNREMAKLREQGLVESLKRRVGGFDRGSGAYVWMLTEGGVKLLHLADESSPTHKQFFTPSLNFLKHTLAVSGAYVELTDICRRRERELVKAEVET